MPPWCCTVMIYGKMPPATAIMIKMKDKSDVETLAMAVLHLCGGTVYRIDDPCFHLVAFCAYPGPYQRGKPGLWWLQGMGRPLVPVDIHQAPEYFRATA